MLCTRVTTRGSAENEPSVSPATATLSPTTNCWSFRGIYLSARTSVFRCQMVVCRDSVSVMHASPEMNITCAPTPSMLEKRLRNIRSRHERAGHMHMCDVSPIDRAAIRSPKQVSGDIGLQHHRHQRLAEGARSIIEFGAAGHTRGEVATRDEHGVDGSIEADDAQLLIRFRLLFRWLLRRLARRALSFLACARR